MIPMKRTFDKSSVGGEIYLITAAKIGDAEGVRLALQSGSDPLYKTQDLTSPLYIAACMNDVATMEVLAEYGALDTINDRFTYELLSPLYGAVRHGGKDAVRWLLKHGAMINTVNDCQNMSPLHQAVQDHDITLVRILVEEGKADINKSFNGSFVTPLLAAIYMENAAMLSELLRLGADAFLPDEQGRMPLQMAAGRGSLACIKMLMDKTDPSMEMQIEALLESLYYQRSATSEYFIDKGTDINCCNRFGSYALNTAIQREKISVVEKLLAHGAKPDVFDKFGTCPLMLATQMEKEDVVALLLKHSASPDIDTGFGRPLHAAVQHGNENLVKTFLSLGADPFAKNEHGNTPLDLARYSKQPRLYALIEAAQISYGYTKTIQPKINPPKVS